MVWNRGKTPTTSHRGAFAVSAFHRYFCHLYRTRQQKWQAGLDIHEGLIAQKYIDEMVTPQHTLITMRWQIALSLFWVGQIRIQQG